MLFVELRISNVALKKKRIGFGLGLSDADFFSPDPAFSRTICRSRKSSRAKPPIVTIALLFFSKQARMPALEIVEVWIERAISTQDITRLLTPVSGSEILEKFIPFLKSECPRYRYL